MTLTTNAFFSQNGEDIDPATEAAFYGMFKMRSGTSQRFELVRAANITNRNCFTDHILLTVENVRSYLHDSGGLFLMTRTNASQINKLRKIGCLNKRMLLISLHFSNDFVSDSSPTSQVTEKPCAG